MTSEEDAEPGALVSAPLIGQKSNFRGVDWRKRSRPRSASETENQTSQRTAPSFDKELLGSSGTGQGPVDSYLSRGDELVEKGDDG